MSQIPGLIEKALRAAIQQMSTHPDEARLFQTNWKKLSAVVDSELDKIIPSQTPNLESDIGGRKRTKQSKRTRRHKKK